MYFSLLFYKTITAVNFGKWRVYVHLKMVSAIGIDIKRKRKRAGPTAPSFCTTKHSGNKSFRLISAVPRLRGSFCRSDFARASRMVT